MISNLFAKFKSLFAKVDKEDRIRGCLIGGAIGDALGYPVEFMSLGEIYDQYGQRIIQLDTEPKWTNVEAGKAAISDDTQMVLFTAMGLIAAEGNPLDSIRKAYLDWLYTQNESCGRRSACSWLCDVPELNARRAPGSTCINALQAIEYGCEPGNNSKGCGGVMRIAPIPLYALVQNKDITEAANLAGEAARITHKHPLGYIPAYVLSHIIYRLSTDASPSSDSFCRYVYEALDYARKRYVDAAEDVDLLYSLLDEAIVLAGKDVFELDAFQRLGEGWVAEETLAIAVYCVAKYFDDFDEALIVAVNHDGDSDSTGAVTGNILGAAIGYKALSKTHKEKLQLHDLILNIADRLSRER